MFYIVHFSHTDLSFTSLFPNHTSKVYNAKIIRHISRDWSRVNNKIEKKTSLVNWLRSEEVIKYKLFRKSWLLFWENSWHSKLKKKTIESESILTLFLECRDRRQWERGSELYSVLFYVVYRTILRIEWSFFDFDLSENRRRKCWVFWSSSFLCAFLDISSAKIGELCVFFSAFPPFYDSRCCINLFLLSFPRGGIIDWGEKMQSIIASKI